MSHLSPWYPCTHPWGQFPVTWWHCWPLLQLPQFNLQWRPYVLLLHAILRNKHAHTSISVHVDKDVENNTSIKKSNIICVKELVINIYQLHYVATNFTHIKCKIIVDFKELHISFHLLNFKCWINLCIISFINKDDIF